MTPDQLEHQLTHLTELNQETIWDAQAARSERDEALARVADLEAQVRSIADDIQRYPTFHVTAAMLLALVNDDPNEAP